VGIIKDIFHRPLHGQRGHRGDVPIQQTQYADQDTINNMMGQLNHPDNNPHRWGENEPLHGVRGPLADALEESGRGQEAALLRQPKQHVILHEGRIVPGRFTAEHIENALDHIDQNIDQPGVFPELHIMNNRMRGNFRPEDMVEPEAYRKKIPRNHLRVVTADTSGTEPHYHADVHLSNLGNHLANEVVNSVDMHGDPEDWGDHDWQNYEQMIQRLRNAPYEEPVPVQQIPS